MKLSISNYRKYFAAGLLLCPMTLATVQAQNVAHSTDYGADKQVVAQVGDKAITLSEVDAYLGKDAFDLKEKLYELRREAVKQIADTMLVQQAADKKHTTVGALLQLTLSAQPEPSALEVDRQWENEYDAMHQLGEVQGRYQVALDMESHAKTEALRAYLIGLETQSNFRVLLSAPHQLVVHQDPGEVLKAGGNSELVIYQDYECPFCRGLAPILSKMVESDPKFTAVTITIKQLPLSIHKRSFEASVAAVCASDQGRFKEMHARLIEDQDHSDQGLQTSAKAVGLKLPEFNQCMSGQQANRRVLADMADARHEGVEATPTLFLAGDKLVLPGDPKDLQSMIDARVKAAPNPTSGTHQALLQTNDAQGRIQ